MILRTKLAPYEENLLKRFRENFSEYVIKASREQGVEDIKEIFLRAIAELFDVEMAFIAEKKGKKLIVLHPYTKEKEAENRLIGNVDFKIDETLNMAFKQGLSLSQDDLRNYPQFERFNSILPIPIETIGRKLQYMFLCNRRETTIHGSFYTTYDSNLCRILYVYLSFYSELPSEDILQSVIKIVEGSYRSLPEEVISDKKKFREKEINNTLCRAKDDIEMFYMPIVSLQNPSNIFGYEMLSRDATESNPNPKGYPREIFEKAKVLGISSKLDNICVKKVFDKIEKVFTNPEENPSLQGKFFFINIHQETVYNNQFKELLKKKSSLILPWFVVFEIIDTGFIKDYEKFREAIKELFLYGYHFADDDHNEWKDERFGLKPRHISIGEKLIIKSIYGGGKETIENLVKGAFDFGGYVVAEYIPEGDLGDRIIKALQENGIFLGQGHIFGEARRTPILPAKQVSSLKETLEKWIKAEEKIKEFYKEMTFLIIDVANSTKIKEGKNELDIKYTFNQYHSYVEGIVKDKICWSGDGGLCVFQDPNNAVNSTIQIQKGLDDFNRDETKNRLKAPITVRIGINTGILLVDESEEKGKWTGIVIDIAGHLQKYSEPGEIRIGEETYKKITDKSNFKESKSIDGVKTYIYQKKSSDITGGT